MFLLSITSFVSSSVFLVYSINVFEKDKVAYIYDTNSVYLETISNQFKNEMRLSSEISKKYLIDYQKNKSFSTGTNIFLDEDSFVKGLFLVDVTGEQPKLVDKITIKSHLGYKITEDQSFLRSLPKLRTEKKALFLNGTNIYISDIVYEGDEKIALVVHFRSDALQSLFEANKPFQAYMLNLSGDVLRQSDGLEKNYLKANFPELFSKLDTIKMGTSEIESKKDELWLLSSSSLGFNDAYLVTLTNKSQAFSVLKYLINKSLIVFFMVLSAVVIASQIASTYLTKRILTLYEAAKQIINGNFKVDIEVKGNDEISLLTKTFNKMAVEIVKLLEDTAEKARIESELKTAQTVQQTLFPPAHHKFENAEICGVYQSASECGGDWWHYFENENTIWIWMADATGHGAPAALITSAIKSAVSMTENLKLDPEKAIELVNKSICQVSKNKMMMTCFLGVIDKRTRVIHYVNASHEAPFILSRKQDLKKRDLRFLDDSKCNRLGQSSSSEYSVVSTQLEAGDRIFVYTDGIPDIRNQQHEPLQERGMIKVVLENHNKGLDVAQFIESIHEQLEAYRQNTELVDDVTYFAVDIG
ncbi:MAG: SpoIIE family protein phosphatase [Pseudobdellovibrio sp.]